jgi:hypothetical protein
MEGRPPRKRIAYEPKGVPAIKDELAFVGNKCSRHAKKILGVVEKFHIELWFDKHYHDRAYLGDSNGRRENIDKNVVEELIKDSISHLIFYSSLVKGFSFLNMESIIGQPLRILLQRLLNNSMLNVLIQAHYINRSQFEITVITAMCVDDFKLASGQYAVEIQGDSSFLKKFENKKYTEIASF